MRVFERSCGSRVMISAMENAATTAMKPRKNGPIEDCVKLWIELITPLRVRKVPKSESAKAPRDEDDVPDAQHVLLLLHHHRVQEGRGDEPGHERGVLDRVPRVPAAPADLLVGPLGAEEDAEAEERPGGERPAPRDDDPALVDPPRGERGHRERERHGQPDVAEVQHRRVGDHVRVLQARVHARAVGRRRLRVERARDDDEQEGEEERDAADDRHGPGKDFTHEPPVEGDGSRGGAGEHEQPEQERALLPAPERGERVAVRELATRQARDVVEARSRCGRARRGAPATPRRPPRTPRRARSSPSRAAAGARARRHRRPRPRRRGSGRRRRRGRRGPAQASTTPARTSTGTS